MTTSDSMRGERRGSLLYNPGAGGGAADRFEKLMERMREMGLQFSTHKLEKGKNPGETATQVLETEKPSWIAVAGGDGTVEAVAACMLDAEIPLAVIPMGTYNNFARSLDLPLDPEDACTLLKAGQPRAVDVGMVNGRPFFECVGVGLDAAIFPYGEEIKSGRVSRVLDALRKARRYRRRNFVISLDRPVCDALARNTANESRRLVQRICRHNESKITLSALMVTVSNGPYFGMNFAVAPEQRMDDGLLTVSVFSRYSKWQLCWHFLSIAFGRHEYCPKSISFRVSKVEIDATIREQAHIDGTPVDMWPVKAECRPGALRVYRK